MHGLNPHLRGQYLIASDTRELKGLNPSSFTTATVWNGYAIYAGCCLPVSQASSPKLSILLLGDLLDYEHHDKTNDDLLSLIVKTGRNAHDVVKLLQDCGGRYVALIRDEQATLAVTDCLAMRHLYWFGTGTQLVISSSPRLILDSLGETPQLNEAAAVLVGRQDFCASEHAWYGDKWYDDRINKVVANHYLDMKQQVVNRTAYFYDGPTGYEDILAFAGKVLTGSIRAAHSRFQVVQALTAGYDSRVLLAASREAAHRTRYYLFDMDGTLNRSSDVRTATALCKQLGLSFEVVVPGRLREDFLSAYREKCFFPRILPKTGNIQWHYDRHRDQRVVNINGNGAEVVRHFVNKKFNGPADFIKMVGFGQNFAPQLEKWHAGALEYCKANGLDVFDLFYWEQRMSNWGASYPFEQDIAIEEFTPFNHKNLLLSLWRIDVKERKSPHYFAIRDLIRRLWPETLSLPVNPIIGLNVRKRLRKMMGKDV